MPSHPRPRDDTKHGALSAPYSGDTVLIHLRDVAVGSLRVPTGKARSHPTLLRPLKSQNLC